jgi:magnesium transporter
VNGKPLKRLTVAASLSTGLKPGVNEKDFADECPVGTHSNRRRSAKSAPKMIRSLVFTTAGKLHSRDIDLFLCPGLLSDTNLFLLVDLESATPEETKTILEQVFHFHPLSIEDCVTFSPIPKVDEYLPGDDDKFAPYLFVVVHGVEQSREDGVFATRELDFFLGKNFLVTYHNGPNRSIALIEDRVIKGVAQVARGPDRLVHYLLDAVIQDYRPALDNFAARIAELEQQALQSPSSQTLNQILRTKKEVRHLLAIISPQREVVARFARGQFNLIRPRLVPYYRDVYDALLQTSNLAQNYADALTGILQVYLNMSSNQTGEVVKLLTLITVITTPLMMVGTWYGMNFKHMPEVNWTYGYPIAAAVTLTSTLATIWYFKRKKWF